MRGTFIAVVGPSGAGKDTLIRAALARRPDLVAARRVVSRPAHDASEDFDSVSPAEFARRRDEGAFALHWHAHGLDYAIPAGVDGPLAEGRHVLANISRGVVGAARARFAPVAVLLVGAPDGVLAGRLAARGREDAGEILERLGHAADATPPGPDLARVDNGGTLAEGIAAFLGALPALPAQPESRWRAAT